MFTPSERLAGLNWQEIRDRYEAGEAVTSIQRAYGIASDNTIRRRARREEWRRPGTEPAPPTAEYLPPEQPSEPQEVRIERTVETITIGSPEPQPIAMPELTSLRAETVYAHLEVAKEMRQTGGALLASIREVLACDATDPTKVATAQGALARLVGVNATTETMASLLKAGTDILKNAVAIERAALSMERGGRSAAGAQNAIAAVSPAPMRPGAGMLRLLDPEMGERLRQLAQQRIKDQRAAEIAGQKAEEQAA